MVKKLVHIWLILLMLSAGAVPVNSSVIPPVIFFVDLASAPKTGGETSGSFSGSYVTLYGNFFGTSQGTSTVTWNGESCLRVVEWGTTYLWYQKIVVQTDDGCSTATGNFVVTVGGQASNGVAHTTKATGTVLCVSTSGNDANTGTFTGGCERNLDTAKNEATSNTIIYVKDGYTKTTEDNFNAVIVLGTNPGTSGSSNAIVAYPGATATLGSVSGLAHAIRGEDYWTIAGLHLFAIDSAGEALQDDGMRWVGNEFSCPRGFGQSACFHTDTSTNVKFFGNYVHNVGDESTQGGIPIDKFYHAVYFTTNSNHLEIAWNFIIPNPDHITAKGGCRALQFFSTGGNNQFDILVHDDIHGESICSMYNFATVNPDSGGAVDGYNNIGYRAGTGPDPQDPSNYSMVECCSANPTKKPQFYYSTLVDAGSRGGNDAGMTAAGTMIFTANVMVQPGTQPFITPSEGSTLAGSFNVMYGNGTKPSGTTNLITTDPKLVDTTPTETVDGIIAGFTPASDGSGVNACPTAWSSGTNARTSPAYDIRGVPRDGTPDCGAIELTTATAPGSGTTPVEVGISGQVTTKGVVTIK